MHTISILSSKGGVGKSTLAISIAVLLKQQGYNVCLLDADFHTPSLHSLFNIKTTNFVDKYINKQISLEDCMLKIEFNEELPGTLHVILADPTSESTNEIVHINARTASNVFQGLMQLKMKLRKPPFNIDYLIIDTSTGINNKSLNNGFRPPWFGDLNIFVMKFSTMDLECTMQGISEFEVLSQYGWIDPLIENVAIIVNKIPKSKIQDNKIHVKISKLVTKAIRKFTEVHVEFWGCIATDPDLIELEWNTTISRLNGLIEDNMVDVIAQQNLNFLKTLKAILENRRKDLDQSVVSDL